METSREFRASDGASSTTESGSAGVVVPVEPADAPVDVPAPAEPVGATRSAWVVGSPPWTITALISVAVAVACSLFVFVQMRPDLLLANTTPAGGDMGAHVWGPAFLRDHILPQLRLSGWTPDWYAGFPAYQYYMVIPSLAIVAINAGFRPIIGIPLGLILVAAAVLLTRRRPNRVAWIVAAALLGVLLVSVPYGISFKLVTVAGVVSLPVVCWAMARLAGASEPVPAFAALAGTIFLFDTNFSITGGNIASTLAGEFAFSISLGLALLAIGLVARGMDTGRGRARAAVVIGLIALCHIIPVFFAMVALVTLVGLGSRVPRLWPVAVAIALALVPVGLAPNSSTGVKALCLGSFVIVLGALIATEPQVRQRVGWILIVGPTAVLLASFWLIPFVGRHAYFNDMGWERLTVFGPKLLTVPMKIALPVAALGLLLSIAHRDRIGLVFATTGVVAASAVVNLPAGALWNERLLPFYYLSVYLLAAVGVAHVARYAAVAMSEDFARPSAVTMVAASLAGLLGTLSAVGVPLRVLPLGQNEADGTYHWLAFTSHARSFVPSWTAWNYSGYERKPAYREYHDIVASMAQVGQTNGCGRAMWEYSKDLDRYGTPMALMLLPFWTDGCIGSMEGLYFESSATTPFHFLNQSVLSEAPSRAQRDLPYQGFNIDKGVAQLQVMGVRYYMAQSDSAIEAARQDPQLTEVAQAPPFVVFQVAQSDLVQGLAYQPVVASGQTAADAGPAASRFDQGWLGEAVRYYNNPATFGAMPAASGPADWPRITTLVPGDGKAITPAAVSNIQAGTSSISFDVDQVGSPVLVKASYFPNWKVSGADGPWRIGPNLMVVVPRSQHVSLNYGRTAIDWLGMLTALLGLAALVALARRDRRPPPLAPAGPLDHDVMARIADGADADADADAAQEDLPDPVETVLVGAAAQRPGAGGVTDALLLGAVGVGAPPPYGPANGAAPDPIDSGETVRMDQAPVGAEGPPVETNGFRRPAGAGRNGSNGNATEEGDHRSPADARPATDLGGDGAVP